MTALTTDVLEILRQRRSAGESVKAMAAELGVTWQKLDKAIRNGLRGSKPARKAPKVDPVCEFIESAIRDHDELWKRHKKWDINTRPEDLPLRAVYIDDQDKRHYVVWVWRTAGAKRPDAILHLALVSEDGHRWGESGTKAERLTEKIKAQVPKVQEASTTLQASEADSKTEATGEAAEKAVKALIKQARDFGPLTEKYRPRSLGALVGQDDVVRVLRKFAAKPFPTVFLFEGETGTGKTSAALALAAELGCDLGQQEFGGVHVIASGEQSADAVRETTRQAWNSPFYGSGWKVVIVNEADRMHPAAETIWLDRLEALPPRTVIVFTTNYAGRMSQRFLDRCTRLKFDADAARLAAKVSELVRRLWKAETGKAPDEQIVEKLVQASVVDGKVSFRRAVQDVAILLS